MESPEGIAPSRSILQTDRRTCERALGAGEGNRNPASWMATTCSTFELHPLVRFSARRSSAENTTDDSEVGHSANPVPGDGCVNPLGLKGTSRPDSSYDARPHESVSHQSGHGESDPDVLGGNQVPCHSAMPAKGTTSRPRWSLASMTSHRAVTT